MTSGPERDPLPVLSAVSALGPFFAVAVHGDGSTPEPGWRPWGDLVGSPEVLLHRARAAQSVLAAGCGCPAGGIPLAVAGSVMHLGLAARLLSPLLALAALGRIGAVPAPADLRWQDSPGSAVPLSLPAGILATPPGPGGPVVDGHVWAAAVTGLLAGLSQAAARITPSPRVRAGNIASAVHGALTVISSTAGAPEDAVSPGAVSPGAMSPDVVSRARGLARLLLAQPALRGAAVGEPGRPGFRRRSCCLIYHAAGPRARPHPVCGDCVLLSAPRHSG